ncbi:MAG: tetratricopeptide repeat protein [Bradymonadia bacterium]
MAFAGSLLAFCIRTLEWCIGPTLSLSVWRTRSLIIAERYLDAVAYSDPQLSTWPDSARLHYCAGRAALALVKRDYARCRMAYAATLNPDEPKYRFGLAYCAQLLGQFETAEREYLAVLERTPGDMNAKINLALLYKNQGHYKRALVHFRDVLDRQPKSAKALYGSALSEYRLENLESAEAYANRCIKLNRRDTKVITLLARIQHKQGRRAEAIEAFQLALSIEPDEGTTLSALGRIYGESDPPKARQFFREALLVARPDVSAHLDLGQCYEALRDYESARSEYILFARYHDGPSAKWARRRIKRMLEKESEKRTHGE